MDRPPPTLSSPILAGFKINLDLFAEIVGIDDQLIVAARRSGDPAGKINGSGENEALIVIGVLANEIDATGCLNTFPCSANRLWNIWETSSAV